MMKLARVFMLAIALILAVVLTFQITVVKYDILVSDLPNIVNVRLCESLGTKLHSFDKTTVTCKNGFQFDLIKVDE
jgi:hypothetical protein